MTSANKIKIKTKKKQIYETIKPTKLTSTNAKLYERRTLTLAKDKRMDIRTNGHGTTATTALVHSVAQL